MAKNLKQIIENICARYQNDRTRMMDIVRAVQEQFGGVSPEAIDLIAQSTDAHRVEVESVVSFYAFLSQKPKGKVIIRLCNDVVDQMKGVQAVARAFSEELGIGFGETTPDSWYTLEWAPCIGMCDQAPAALINDVMVTNLTTDKAKEIVRALKLNPNPPILSTRYGLGDGNNANALVQSMVQNNVKKTGEVLLCDVPADAGLRKAIQKTPEEVIAEVEASKLRGRGGAGFPTGLKWKFTRGSKGPEKFILCNADEGEPGTFKDRVLLTERAHLVFEGMTIGGYAIGATTGILYLRGEYAYLRPFLEDILQKRRAANLLGNNILGKDGFHFDIRIQMGAGAYICGEETSLISSCEGLRGDPKNRPPFPPQQGYLRKPTSVNNVETFAAVARILDKGAAWFAAIGSGKSTGTKLLSISGDCKNPGVYEYPFGVQVRTLLQDVGAENTQALLIGGPSGQFIGAESFDKTICYDDLATGGAIVIFNKDRNMIKIAQEYMEFFVEESCGYCTPCRVGNVLIDKCLQKILAGQGEPSDIEYLQNLGNTVKKGSRCGLGQTSPNPALTTIKNFRAVYDAVLKPAQDGMQPTFDLKAAVSDAEALAGRHSVIH
ncbi:MAG: NAD(P)H-dependent oxidoreductase subunit E [Deltaproteobacteria bacterium]|nr:NAD(P)H-dependent oxidoreductase subunit E [Deltaproteobacteria bacterium]